MLLHCVLITIFALPALISGAEAGQFPTINGVIGGVPPPDARTFKTLSKAFENAASPTTPGKLRVVENSSVCGTVMFFTTHSLSY